MPGVEQDVTDLPADPRRALLDDGGRARRDIKAALFGSTAKEERVEDPTPAGDADADAPPSRVGRFAVTGQLGRGGMGVVLSGWDEELERKVAVKLMHRSLDGEHGDRLRREAKALARLSHPNVVQIYEVGTWDGRLFIAMELVRGKTLRRWLAEADRSFSEMVDVFVAAGRGLAAAHGKGLVHRDFKPDNVIVGRDGRPRILDFGLARAGSGKDETDPLASAMFDGTTELERTLTVTGAVLGTPAYMSPEQLKAEATSAATDQFAFCVALWEAVYGKRPFAGRSFQSLRLAICGGEREPPPPGVGPPGLAEVLGRGLATDPARRWPDMGALLDALSALAHPPAARPRWPYLLGAGVVAAGVTTAAVWPSGTAAPAAASCVPAAERLAAVWDPFVIKRLDAKFADRDLPRRARDWFPLERGMLDTFVADWTRVYEESCRSDPPEVFERRQTCLDARLIEIKTRVALLDALEPAVRADAASGDFPPFYLPRDCEDETVVEAVVPLPSEPSRRAEVLDATQELNTLSGAGIAAFVAGRGADPKLYASLMKVGERIEAAGHVPAIAEFEFRIGNGLVMFDFKVEEGWQRLQRAMELAEQAGDEVVWTAAHLRKHQHRVLRGELDPAGDELGEILEAERAALERIGEPAALYSFYLQVRARREAALGDRAAATRSIVEAARRYRETFGATPYPAVVANQNLVWRLRELGATKEASALAEETIAQIRDELDAHSPLLWASVDERTSAAVTADRLDDALRDLRELQRLAPDFDPGSLQQLVTVQRGQAVHFARGEVELARPFVEQLWAQRDAVEPRNPLWQQVWGAPLRLALITGDTGAEVLDVAPPGDAARPFIGEMLSALQAAGSDDPVAALEAAQSQMQSPQGLAAAWLLLGRAAEARGEHGRARTAFETAMKHGSEGPFGRDHLMYDEAELGAIRNQRAGGDVRGARDRAKAMVARLEASAREHGRLPEARALAGIAAPG